MGKSTYRAEYFQAYRARRKELKWPKCPACGVKARKLPKVGCLECLARDWHLREWGTLEKDLIEIHAGKDEARHLQLRIYYETGEPRTQGAIKRKTADMGIRARSHQDYHTIPQLVELTGRDYLAIRSFIRRNKVQNFGKGRVFLISDTDAAKVIEWFQQESEPSYSVSEAADILGCSVETIRKVIRRGVPSWKHRGSRRVCKVTVDRAVVYLKESGATWVDWRLILNG